MNAEQLLKTVGGALVVVIAGVGLLLLGLGRLSKALNGKPNLDLGYHDPTIEDSVIWSVIGWTALAAAGYLALHVLTA